MSDPLAASLAPAPGLCPGPSLPGSTCTHASTQAQHPFVAARAVYRENVSSNPHDEVAGNKKVSSLYVPCLSNNICWVASENSGSARDLGKGTPLEATGTWAQTHSTDSHIAGTRKPPSVPLPELCSEAPRDASGHGTGPAFPDTVRPPVLGPKLTSELENQKRNEPSPWQPCFPAKARN